MAGRRSAVAAAIPARPGLRTGPALPRPASASRRRARGGGPALVPQPRPSALRAAFPVWGNRRAPAKSRFVLVRTSAASFASVPGGRQLKCGVARARRETTRIFRYFAGALGATAIVRPGPAVRAAAGRVSGAARSLRPRTRRSASSCPSSSQGSARWSIGSVGRGVLILVPSTPVAWILSLFLIGIPHPGRRVDLGPRQRLHLGTALEPPARNPHLSGQHIWRGGSYLCPQHGRTVCSPYRRL